VSWIVPFTKYYAGNQITGDEIGGSFGMHGRGLKWLQGFSRDTWRKEPTWTIQANMAE